MPIVKLQFNGENCLEFDFLLLFFVYFWGHITRLRKNEEP